MPIFEYRCENCGLRFEQLLRRRQEPPGSCPQCQSGELKKLFSSFSPAAGQASSPCDPGVCPSAASGGCEGAGCPF